MSGTESDAEMEVGEVLGERKSRKGLEFLVRWKGYAKADDTWELLKNLANAQGAISAFREKISSSPKKKSRKSSSRSRSRSGSRGRGRPRSTSRSPARNKKRASPSRSSSRSRKSLTNSTTINTITPAKEEIKTETVTQSPGRLQRTTETLTRSVATPADTQRTQSYSRTTEVRTLSTNPDSGRPSSEKPSGEPSSTAGRWWQCCCTSLQNARQCCGGMIRSDYPAMVVFVTISIIMLSFVVQQNVDFEKVWASIVAFCAGIWAWLTALVSK